MANSSEWMGALEQPRPAQPGWLALLDEPAEFREAFVFGAAQPAASADDPLAPAFDPGEDALARAFADGEAAGRAAAEAEAEAAAARQRALRLAFRTIDETARDVLADDLAETVIALCEAALADCAIDKDALLARCHTAAKRIGGAAETLTLHLHPDDLTTLDTAALGDWQVMPDPALDRGAVMIAGPEGAVSDGPAEWRRAIAAAVRG
ncbi:MAG: FliH/SctL family protein [Erythrobacter sp.]|nr:FliH/SctL family protein [Erythrobacter sp.]